MALTELTALETAYQVLAPLNEAARRRALQWLADALGENQPLAARSDDHSRQGAPSVAAADTAAVPTAKPTVGRRRRAPSPNATVKGSRKQTREPYKRAKSAALATSAGRPYRRMPEATEVMRAYERIGTFAGLAEHFDVPQHTVTHWARRLRGEGYQIGRTG